MSVVYFLLLVGVLVVIHELGHFAAAKLLDVKVLRFSIGYGRPLVRFKLRETDLKLTPRGTFSGNVDIAGGAPLGQYRIIAKAGAASASEYFEVQEYKKPEYKVTVTTPKKFVEVGQKVKFSIEARYFFGEPVKQADVQYYIYRSRYYPSWWADEDEAESSDSESEEEDP